jgi:hypothetical protein
VKVQLAVAAAAVVTDPSALTPVAPAFAPAAPAAQVVEDSAVAAAAAAPAAPALAVAGQGFTQLADRASCAIAPETWSETTPAAAS